jgi:hypothetical protein
MATPAPTWTFHRLVVAGPAEDVAVFAAAARGPGFAPWRVDYDRLEEDAFNMTMRESPGRRALSVEGCRIMARQYRENVQAHHALAAQPGRCVIRPFDLHALLPAPDAILQLGRGHPEAEAWMASNWGAGELRRVALLKAERLGKALPKGHEKIGFEFFAEDVVEAMERLRRRRPARPAVAVAQLAFRWPALMFALRP